MYREDYDCSTSEIKTARFFQWITQFNYSVVYQVMFVGVVSVMSSISNISMQEEECSDSESDNSFLQTGTEHKNDDDEEELISFEMPSDLSISQKRHRLASMITRLKR